MTVAMDWADDARCQQMGLAPFFPELGQTFDGARAVCVRCPVREQCLRYALAIEGDAGHERRAGMWGGATPRQRWHIARCSAGMCAHRTGQCMTVERLLAEAVAS